MLYKVHRKNHLLDGVSVHKLQLDALQKYNARASEPPPFLAHFSSFFGSFLQSQFPIVQVDQRE